MNKATKWFYFGQKHPFFRKMVGIILRTVYACDLPLNNNGGIGSNCVFEHNALGVVISNEVTIGDNCRVYQHVTIGAGNGGYPKIGNNVTIYANTTIVGGIIIGDNVIIGANSFVNKDIPANTTVGGVPAKIIKGNQS